MQKKDLISEILKENFGDFVSEIIMQTENSRIICFRSNASDLVYSFGETRFLNLKNYQNLYKEILTGKLLGETLVSFFKEKLMRKSDSFVEIDSPDFIKKITDEKFFCRNTKFTVMEENNEITLVEIREYLNEEVVKKIGLM